MGDQYTLIIMITLISMFILISDQFVYHVYINNKFLFQKQFVVSFDLIFVSFDFVPFRSFSFRFVPFRFYFVSHFTGNPTGREKKIPLCREVKNNILTPKKP